MPTQFKRDYGPLRIGHHMPLLGIWSKEEGYVKKNSLEYDSESLACPVIAVIEKKMGGLDVTLTITAKISEYDETVEETQGDYTSKRKKYKPTEDTIVATLKIPRHTRPWGTWVVSGLGQNVYEITSITDDVSFDTGKIYFYALASSGSKIIYWLGIHKLAEQLRTILRPWIAPSKCTRCGGTGVEPNTGSDCLQCNGYKYSGYSAVGSVQKKLGFDVGLARELVDWDDMSSADYDAVDKFINKCWTQKWWVTPTMTEIKRIFAHFYAISEEEILIEERFNLQEPVWSIYLPTEVDPASPFGSLTVSDRELMEYMAESITPAGVSVFVGFYADYFMGDLEDIQDEVFIPLGFFESSSEHLYSLLSTARFDFYNGWTKATQDFEEESLSWYSSGSVDIFNANDQNRHVCRFDGNAYISTGMVAGSGFFELWVHPQDTVMKYGVRDASGDWMFYVEYNGSGFFDHFGALLTLASPDCDYHIRVDFDGNMAPGAVDIYIMREKLADDVNYLNYSANTDEMFVESIGTGYGFVDAIGLSIDPNYELNDNWQRLHPWGWGMDHVNDLSGITDLLNNYFKKDKFFDVN